MSTLPASAGWRWIKQGFALFRMRPGLFAMLFTGYLLLQIGLVMIPVIGFFAQPLLAPTFSVVFMTACAQIERHGQINPLQLRASFEPLVSRRLLILGAVYFAGSMLMLLAVMAVFSLMGGGPFLELLTSTESVTATTEQNVGVLLTMLAFFLVALPVIWYAPPLIVWQKMPVFKAMFYSFFSVIRSYRTFLVYFLLWLVIGALLPSILVGMLALIVGKGFAMLLLFLLWIVLSVVLYCSFYPTYVDMFGQPELPEVGELDLS